MAGSARLDERAHPLHHAAMVCISKVAAGQREEEERARREGEEREEGGEARQEEEEGAEVCQKAL